MDNSLKTLIDPASSILVLLPSQPTFDEVAAGLSLYLSLKAGKQTAISSPSPMLVEFNRLVGVNQISSEMGNKNLVIKFADYKATDIERVSYDIESGQFQLTVIPKPGVLAPDKSQVQVGYTGIAAEAVILVGGAEEAQFPALAAKDLVGAKVIHVGVQELRSQGGQILSFARPASSISELVAQTIHDNQWNLDQDIATNLIAGIEVGSDQFTSPYVSAETFQLVADLMRMGAQRRTDIAQPEAYPPGAIPGQTPPQAQRPPEDWMTPKVYKGTSVS